jgi:hypothetical protein
VNRQHHFDILIFVQIPCNWKIQILTLGMIRNGLVLHKILNIYCQIKQTDCMEGNNPNIIHKDQGLNAAYFYQGPQSTKA